MSLKNDRLSRHSAARIAVCLILSSAFVSATDHGFLSTLQTDFTNVAVALNNVLNFMTKYYDQLNIDALFGVVLAQAQLEIAREILNENQIDTYIVRKMLDRSIQKCEYILTISKKVVPIQSKQYLQFFNVLLKPNIWHVRPVCIENGTAFPPVPVDWTIEQLYENTYFGGVINETVFDQCFGILLENLDRRKPGQEMECQISNRCYSLIMKQSLNETHGYVLSHRLLFVQMIRAIGCKASKKSLQKATYKFCSRIYPESLAIESYKFPIHLRDIFLEQVLLCGMEGYYQFLSTRWLREILKWQQKEGCYSSTVDTNVRRKKRDDSSTNLAELLYALEAEFSDGRYRTTTDLHRTFDADRENGRTDSGRRLRKRESSMLPFDCASHITGLSVGVFGLYIKDILASSVYMFRRM